MSCQTMLSNYIPCMFTSQVVGWFRVLDVEIQSLPCCGQIHVLLLSSGVLQ